MPLAIGAVVEGLPTTSQTPLSGHFCPVVAVVPIGDLDIRSFLNQRSATIALFGKIFTRSHIYSTLLGKYALVLVERFDAAQAIALMQR
ncbi:hypothetical protein ACTVPP_20365, partial [Serratia ureilytica]